MAALTGTQAIQGAFALLNVFLPGESIPANDGEFARVMLNDLLSEWSQETRMVPVIARERFTLTIDKGGPGNPYTIGSGGNFNTERPANQAAIPSANLILTTTTPEVRVPLGIYTDQAYNANQLPGMSNTQPTGLYYNPTYANDLGSIFLWPVPTVNYNELELFLQKPVAQFANLSTTYYVPNGMPRLIKYNLACALADPYGRQVSARVEQDAARTLGAFRRSNHKMSDLRSDAYFGASRHTIYNIETGQ